MSVRPEDYDEIVKRINRKYENDVGYGNSYDSPNRVSTGSLELDAAMGGGIPIGRWSRFYGGYHCLREGTLILRADYQWVPVETLEAGDQIVGFDEDVPGGRGRRRRFKNSTVLDNPIKRLPSRRVIVDQGEEVVASSEHLWLIAELRLDGSCNRTCWKRTDQLQPGDRILWFGKPWATLATAADREAAGYLAGLFDGDGTVNRGRVQLYQNQGAVLDRAKAYLDQLDFETLKYNNRTCKRLTIEATVSESMRFFAQIPTARLANGAGSWWQGREIGSKGRFRGNSYATVVANEDVGEQEVFAIGTSSQTLIANGMFSHNSTKTLTALRCIAEAQKLGMLCAYYDAEKQFDPVFASKNLGVNVDELTLVKGSSIEAIGEKMEALFGVVHFHVLDSCTICVSEDELVADVRDWRPGITARAWGKVFKRLNERFDHTDNTVIMIDQVRTDFRTGSEQAAGGRIMDHQSSMSVHFKKGGWLSRTEDGYLDEKAKQGKGMSGQMEPDGIEIKARVQKSRVGRPFKTATMRLDLGSLQFDNTFEYIKAAKFFEIIEHRGAGHYYLNDQKIAHGEAQLRKFIEGDLTLQEQIKESVMRLNDR